MKGRAKGPRLNTGGALSDFLGWKWHPSRYPESKIKEAIKAEGAHVIP